MKTNRYFFIAALGLAALASCKDPNANVDPVNPVEPGTPVYQDLVVSNASLMTQVGSAVTTEVSSGNDGYDVFSLDPDVATATISGKTITVTGQSTGRTDIVVTDAGYKVVRVPFISYEVPGIELAESSKSAAIMVGGSDSFTVGLTSGNGGYEFQSDTEGVSATFDEANGNVVVTAVGKIDPYTAHVTVTDVCGFESVIDLTIEPSFNYWTDARKQTVINSTSTFYYSVPSFLNTGSAFNLTRKQTSSSYSYHAGKTDTGFSYGYKRIYNNTATTVRYIDIKIDIKGDLSVGPKEGHLYGIYYYLNNGELWWNSILDTDTDDRNLIEIVSNNGSIVKGVVSYFYDGAVHNMYFIDSVVN